MYQSFEKRDLVKAIDRSCGYITLEDAEIKNIFPSGRMEVRFEDGRYMELTRGEIYQPWVDVFMVGLREIFRTMDARAGRHADCVPVDESSLEKYSRLFSQTVSKDGDYHQVHPKGHLTSGRCGAFLYQTVIQDGRVSYVVMVHSYLDLVWMFSDNGWSVCSSCDHGDRVLACDNPSKFISEQLEADDIDASGFDLKDYLREIGEYAYYEIACPRWGMSWG